MAVSSSQVTFDRVAAVLGLVVALALLPLQFVVSHIYAQTIPVVLGVACALYLYADRREATSEPLALPRWATHALPGLVVFGTAALVLLGHRQGGRTTVFYGLAGLLGTLVLAQTLFAREGEFHPGVVLLQTILLGAVIRLVPLVTSAGFIGIDIWLHVPQFTRGLLAANSIEGMGQTKYVMAPLYHLLVATTSLFGALTLRSALYLSLGLAMPLAPLFIYGASRLLVPGRWAVFATVLFTLGGSVIRWSIHLIPTSLGLVFFLATLFMIVRLFQVETGGRDTLVILLLFVAMALTHQVSSFILLVFLAAGWGTQLILRTGIMDPPRASSHRLGPDSLATISFSGYFIFNLGLLTLTWSLTPYYGRPFLETAFNLLREAIGGSLSDVTGPTSAGGAAQQPSLVQQVLLNFDVLGFLLFMFGTVVGGLYSLRRGRTNQAVLTFLAAAAVMSVFTLVPPLIGVGTFLSGRWFAFLFAVMAVLTAVGFGYLWRDLSPTLLLAVLLIFAYAFPVAMIASPKATIDQPVVEHERPRFSLEEEEYVGMVALGQITPANESDTVHSDFPYFAIANRNHNTERFRVTTVPAGGRAQQDEVVYRRYQTTGAPLFGSGQGGRIFRVTENAICPDSRDKVYDNGNVRYCKRS